MKKDISKSGYKLGGKNMKTMVINGREIKTNFRQSFNGYPISDGNNKKTMSMHIQRSCREGDDEMLERLAAYGYKTITFYYTTTRVKGIYNLIAYCK